MANEAFRILGIVGSLRAKSYNRGLMRAMIEEVPQGIQIEVFDLAPIPPFNEDVLVAGRPEPAQRLWDGIRGADALLIVTPEYNYSVPGVLKNAIDWASRPPAETPLRHKPVGLMGATTGGFGTTRAQLALRQSFVFTDSYAMLNPQLMISGAAQKFDENGNLTDQTTREQLRPFLDALRDWARRVGTGG